MPPNVFLKILNPSVLFHENSIEIMVKLPEGLGNFSSGAQVHRKMTGDFNLCHAE